MLSYLHEYLQEKTKMKKKTFSPHLAFTKELWIKHLKKEDLVIDATCGNGHDTKFLSTLSDVIALDIQDKAIESAKSQAPNVTYHLMCHSKIDELILTKAPHLVVYNLGYLPGADKNLTTMVTTTLQSIEKSLKLIDSNGAICITCYPGHEEGFVEEKALIAFCENLDSVKWQVLHYRWLNRHRSPSVLWIEKIA
jgi:hypothetical protein